MLESGTAAYAEANRLIVLSPQTSRYGIYGGGCWDWSGGTSAGFDTHAGLPLSFVRGMLTGLTRLIEGSSWP